MRKKLSFRAFKLRGFPQWLGLVLAAGIIIALGAYFAYQETRRDPITASTGENLQQLDTRADGSRILNMVAHAEPRDLPAVKFIDHAGNQLSLEDFRGKVVALHFWATWCFPCREELPTVDALQEELGGEDITFVPLSVDRDGAKLVSQYYADNNIVNLPVYIDDGMNAARALLINGIPYTILIDREGREFARILGDRDWSTPEVAALMRKLIQ
jgi:thiol-disulfide isomerase/thioredoxin